MFTQIVKIEYKDNLHHLKVTKITNKRYVSHYLFIIYLCHVLYGNRNTYITPHRHVLALFI